MYFIKSNVKYLLVFLYLVLASFVFSQTITVNDGTGSDTDWWTSNTTFSANWSDTIDWMGKYATDNKYYQCTLGYFTGSTWNNSSESVIVTGISALDIPPKNVLITKSPSGAPLNLAEGNHYIMKVEAFHIMVDSIYLIKTGYSDGVTTDFTPPSVTVTSPSASVVTSSTFTLQWSGSDAGSGVASYDVQYKTGNGAWQDLLTAASSTRYQFTGNNGYTYTFRVRAADEAGNISDWTLPQAQSTVSINAMSPSVSLSVTPGTLSFSANENEKGADISIQATGGSLTVTSVTESRNYPGWGTEDEIPDNMSVSITGGSRYTLHRTIQLDNIARSRALGNGTKGSFTVTYTVEGQDSYGHPVAGNVSIPVTVSGGLSSSLSINNVTIELPPSPYYVGDTVENARVTIDASGSGTATGQILVDDDTSWSSNPGFSVNVNNTTSFNINGTLPTDSPGSHTVKVEITDPVTASAEETYTVSSETPPFPPTVLTLVQDVAELTDLNGNAEAVNGDTYKEFHFTGTAKMKIFPLKDDNGNPTIVNDVTVTELVVRYNDDNPTKAKIRGGTVEKEVTGDEVIATVGNRYLRVKKVSFTGQKSPATDFLRIDTKLYIPKLHMEFFKIGGLVLKTEGIEAKAVSVAENKAKTFNAFGMEFRIHNVDAEQAIVVGKDKANDRYYFTLSGGIAMSEKSGTTKTKKEITTFKGLTFYTDGNVDGTITFKKSFDIIPDKLTLTKIQVQKEGDTFKMKLGGELKNLPYPLDSLGTTTFEFKFDKDGNAEGLVVPIHELQNNNKGHGLGNNDQTEWNLGIAQIDITYLGLYLQFNEGDFDKDHSEIQIGMDLYLDLKDQDGSDPSDSGKRISFGELNTNGDFTGGIRISMDGDVTWHQPTDATIIQHKKLELAALTISIDGLAVAPDPFRIIFTGGILINLQGVAGEVDFENLAIGLDGSVSNLSDAIQGGMLDVVDAVHIEVDDVDWSSDPATLTFQSDATSGEGEDRAPQKSSKTVDVQSYLRFMGASISLGSSDDPVMNGGFDELTFYKLQNGSFGLVLSNATLSTSGVDLRADIEYQDALLRVAGEVDLPNDISAVAVGKIGSQNGEPTMGIFIAASGLSIAVGPGVFLNEIGGGVFINPVQEDVELVRHIARFERPELSDDITSKRPGGAENPGSFAIMILGGVYISAPDFVYGRALVTITANYFNLDAEVECLDGMLDGTAYLAIGWNPSYGEGNVVVNMDYLSIIEGSGSLEFYVYSKDLWGVAGAFNISMLGHDLASGSLFVGPPGFMLETSVSFGIDMKFISGSLTYGGMFWYYKVPDPDTWGAYVKVAAEGDFLDGLFSASASLEGALIGSPTFLIYAVGSLSVKVCYVTVFNGSLWVSVGENGFHGGKGRNAKYDGIIEEARNMADAMNQAKEELNQAMNDAELELTHLNAAQRDAAGLALVERSGILGGLVQIVFTYNELNRWDPEGLPPALRVVYDRIYGPGQQNLVVARTRLQQLVNKINHDISNLETLQQEIAGKIDQYEDILVEELPSVQDIGNLQNPFQGKDEKTVTIGGTTRTVQSGFRINESAAENQQNALLSVREDFAKYQDAFMKEAGNIDAKLQQLDEILFQSDQNLSELASQYGNVYSEMGNYINNFVAFQGKNYQFAERSLELIQHQASESQIHQTSESQIRQALTDKDSSLSVSALNSWNNDRISLIQALIQAGSTGSGEQPEPYNPPLDLSPYGLFQETGVELWWNIPIAGFTKSKTLSLERRTQAIASFKQSAASFRGKWSSATNLINRIYERKSALYNILYEIYDELSEYGTGMIGVDSSGNASAFGGFAGTGLAFRTSAVASAVSGKGEMLPPGTTAPDEPTIGPLRPAVPVKKKPGFKKFGSHGMIQPQNEGTGIIAFGPAVTVTPPAAVSGISGNSFNNSTIKLGVSSMGLPSQAVIDRNASQPAQNTKPTSWVPVAVYFDGKRAEIEPYLEVPHVENFTGQITSQNQFTALLTAEFSGSHPVGVVEYEYKLEPVPGVQTTGNVSNTQISMGGGIPAIAQLTPLLIYIPWFTLGDATSLTEPFFPDINKAGEYYLYVKIRGAGGKSIIRRARLNLNYFNPQADHSPVSSSIDTSDTTPPSKPVVTLEGPYTYRIDKIYAKWDSEDLESGIQGYKYAVGTYKKPQNLASTQTAYAGAAVPGQSNTLEILSGSETPVQPQVPTDILGWQSAGGRKELNITGLRLMQGKSYVVSVRAENGVGLKSTGSSPPILVDTTAPHGLSITTLEQVNADNHANSVHFVFNPATDEESGIASHSFAVGTSEGSDDLVSWQDSSGAEATIVNIPLPRGSTVFVTVKTVNGAGLGIQTSDSIDLAYTDQSPPQEPVPVSISGRFISDPGKLSIGWMHVDDPESGIVGYSYGIGTSRYYPDVVPWSSVDTNENAYVLNQGSKQGKNKQLDYHLDLETLHLSSGKAYYILVKAKNGSGLESTGASEPVVVDTTPPHDTEVQASEESTARDHFDITVKAKDEESGIASYRFAVWDVQESSYDDEIGEPGAFSISGGFTAPGTFSGNPDVQGIIPETAAGSTVNMNTEIPPWAQDVDLWGQPKFESDWENISSGALPEEINLAVKISGFSTGLGALFGGGYSLKYGKSYRIKVWVRNGAGLEKAAGAVIIKVVRKLPGKHETNKDSNSTIPKGGF